MSNGKRMQKAAIGGEINTSQVIRKAVLRENNRPRCFFGGRSRRGKLE